VDPRLRAPDGRDAHRRVSVLGTLLPEKDDHNIPARATSPIA
jgi:hypothetical protein